MAQILGTPVDQYSSGRMTYDLRRLRLHGPIERIPHTHRYRVTEMGTRVAFFFTKIHSRILRPGLSELWGGCPKSPNRAIANAMNKLDQAIGALFQQAKLAPCETRSICKDDSESKLPGKGCKKSDCSRQYHQKGGDPLPSFQKIAANGVICGQPLANENEFLYLGVGIGFTGSGVGLGIGGSGIGCGC